jgi:hypothetical protein
MSAKQASFLVSRVISLFFIYQGFRALLEVPATFAMISAFSSMSKMSRLDEYGTKMFASAMAMALEGAVQIILAIIFYRCGARMVQFLTGEERTSEVLQQP